MKSAKVFILANLVMSFGASALPVTHFSSNKNYDRRQVGSQIQSLLKHVNIPAQYDANGELVLEPRVGLDQFTGFGPNVRQTGEQKRRARATSGPVYCPGDDGAQGSGFLVDESGIVATAAHIFYKKDCSLRAGLDKCFFQNQEARPLRVDLDFNEGAYDLPACPYGDRSNDLALVRLKQRLPSAKLFPLVNIQTKPLVPGQSIVMISAYQQGLKVPVKLGEPIAQTCNVMEIGFSETQQQIGFYSTCAGARGASGSINLVQEDDGNWAIVGITVASGSSVNDYAPYDKHKGSATYSLVMDQSLSKRIATLKSKRPKGDRSP